MWPDWDPTQHWTDDDVEHYRTAFDQPGAWFHAISYYRDAPALPPARRRRQPHLPDPGPGGRDVASPRLALQPPRLRPVPGVLPPRTWAAPTPTPALYLYSAFLMPQAFADGYPADDHIPSGNLYADSFIDHFPDYRARPAPCSPLHPRRSPHPHQRRAPGLPSRRNLTVFESPGSAGWGGPWDEFGELGGEQLGGARLVGGAPLAPGGKRRPSGAAPRSPSRRSPGPRRRCPRHRCG